MSSALCRRRLLGFLMTMLFPEGMSGEGYAEVVAKQQPYTKLPNLAFYANYKWAYNAEGPASGGALHLKPLLE